jgi:hypothetical protein
MWDVFEGSTVVEVFIGWRGLWIMISLLECTYEGEVAEMCRPGDLMLRVVGSMFR